VTAVVESDVGCGSSAFARASVGFNPQFRDQNRRDIGKISVKMDRFQDGNARLTVWLWARCLLPTRTHARTHAGR
jgi:hypothetical protein